VDSFSPQSTSRIPCVLSTRPAFHAWPRKNWRLAHMDVARRSRRYSDTELRQLNYCRLFLHVTTISEILDAPGAKHRVLTHMAKCSRPSSRPSPRLNLASNDGSNCTIIWNPSYRTSANGPFCHRAQTHDYGEKPTYIYHWHAGCYWRCSPLHPSRASFSLTEPSKPFQVMHILGTLEFYTTHLLIVSDGSSFESESMSFGVTIGTTTGTIIAENKRPAFGRPSSHRAECTGCLSGALLLHHLQQFTQLPLSKHLQLFACSDNNGMITSLTDRKTYNNVYHTATLVSDWDLLEEIYQTYQKIPAQHPTYKWVRGHQDSTTKPSNLPIEAQLNIRANCLAGEYHNTAGRQAHQQTPLMQHTRCILQIKGASTHAKYMAEIRRASTETEYSAYLQRRHKWTPLTYKTLAWTAFRMAARTYHSTEVHLLKLLHDILPTRSHTARFQPWTNPSCHHCTERDTIDHLQQSRCNPISSRYSIDVEEALDAYFEKSQAPQKFREIFQYCIRQWITQNKEGISMTSAQWHGSANLHTSQSEIGWRLMTRGFLSSQWATFLHQTLHNDKWRTKHNDIIEFDDKRKLYKWKKKNPGNFICRSINDASLSVLIWFF
jgi:hypothetical protein